MPSVPRLCTKRANGFAAPRERSVASNDDTVTVAEVRAPRELLFTDSAVASKRANGVPSSSQSCTEHTANDASAVNKF